MRRVAVMAKPFNTQITEHDGRMFAGCKTLQLIDVQVLQFDVERYELAAGHIAAQTTPRGEQKTHRPGFIAQDGSVEGGLRHVEPGLDGIKPIAIERLVAL